VVADAIPNWPRDCSAEAPKPSSKTGKKCSIPLSRKAIPSNIRDGVRRIDRGMRDRGCHSARESPLHSESLTRLSDTEQRKTTSSSLRFAGDTCFAIVVPIRWT
jgi:hypothetical protein